MRTRASGAARIFLYNWTTYVLTWLVSGVVALAAPRGALGWLLVLGAGVAIAWSLVSLLVSRHVYDVSPLVRGDWMRPLLPSSVESWATLDSGLDAEVELDSVMPGRCVGRFDIYDGEKVGALSVRRARAMTQRARPAMACPATRIPLPDRSCDVVAVVFTAHEIHEAAVRDAFFREVRRTLRPGGRLMLVEHLRDTVNFLAFGPGFLHFLPRSEWLRLARTAGFRVAHEGRVTPWVMCLMLEPT